jgi:alpha-ketoglutarate-dependent taurine dioxygenase
VESRKPKVAIRPAAQSCGLFLCGTLTIWDNRCTQHSAVNDYHGQRRRMRRLTVGAQTPR